MDITQLTPHIIPRLIYGKGIVVNAPAVYEQVEELVSPATYKDIQVETTPAVYEARTIIDTPAVIAEAGQVLFPAVLDEQGVEITPAVIASGGEVITPAVTHEEMVEVTPATYETRTVIDQEAVYQTVNGDLLAPAKYGVLIPHSVTQMVGFQPDEHWQEEAEGYFSTHLRLVVLQRSPVEIYSVQGNPPVTRYHGPAVDANGKVNDYLKSADQEPDSFDIYSRTLVFFVDDQNNLLHDLPIRLDLSKGEGGNFAAALKSYYFVCCRQIFKALNEPMQWLDNKALAHLVFECDLALDSNGYIAPSFSLDIDLESVYIPIVEGGLLSDWFSVSSSFPGDYDKEGGDEEGDRLLAYYGVKEI